MHRQMKRQFHLLGDYLSLPGRVEIMGDRSGAKEGSLLFKGSGKGDHHNSVANGAHGGAIGVSSVSDDAMQS
jgi:hypothetical protein